MNKTSIIFALCALSTTINAQMVPLLSGPSTVEGVIYGTMPAISTPIELSHEETTFMISGSGFTYSDIDPRPWTSSEVDCEYFDHQTNWEEIAGVTYAIVHGPHNWVYAKRSDVNKTIDWIYADHCPCGCPQTENEARICSVCYREEQRTRTWGYNLVTRGESEYMKIKNR